MRAALLNFEKQPGTKIAILGDMFELGTEAEQEHQALVDLASSLLLNKVILIGENFFKSKIVSSKVMVFKSFDEFKKQLKLESIQNATLLIKGSRGMALERVLELI